MYGSSMAIAKMHVEIWSDIACPWCYVGKRRFEQALGDFEHRDRVDVVWRSFQLDPAAPPERQGNYRDMLARKYGRPPEQAQAMLDEMTEMGAAEGLKLRFDLIRPGNTMDGHRILHLAATEGKQHEMKERLMRAYLCEGELISDHPTLARLADEVGLPADRVEEVLGSREFADRIEAELDLGVDFGISGVPFFVLERKMGGAGAQPVEVFGQLLQKAWDKVGPDAAPAA